MKTFRKGQIDGIETNKGNEKIIFNEIHIQFVNVIPLFVNYIILKTKWILEIMKLKIFHTFQQYFFS